ncbi:helix-turn-helix domain-containing protein [Hymenobacter terricola]|uniref:helix-turn-helix domain-containing protein n=1 Tax=Hymenobacter terricola TaxID=2819236 RepID=UPI001B31885C|nr:AraC family transcriptional regulator [Hymenobacter terricola]
MVISSHPRLTPASAFAISPLGDLRPLVHRHAASAAFTRWQQYAVVLVEGSGTTTAWPVELYFSSPGQLALAQVPAGAQGRVIRFTDEFIHLTGDDQDLLLLSLFHESGAGQGLAVPPEQAEELAFLLTSVQRQADSPALLRDALLRAYLKTLLICCLRLSQQQALTSAPPAQSGLFLRFRKLLEAHYTDWKSVAEYASQLHVTANHLSMAIRKETGRPASAHIRQRIMLEAQRLVSLRDVPLKEVAYQLGFEDVSHFSKLFKRTVGVTFSQFKERIWAQHGPCRGNLSELEADEVAPAPGRHYALSAA